MYLVNIIVCSKTRFILQKFYGYLTVRGGPLWLYRGRLLQGRTALLVDQWHWVYRQSSRPVQKGIYYLLRKEASP